MTPAPVPKASNQSSNVVSSGVVLAAAPKTPALIDIDNTDTAPPAPAAKSKTTKNNEKALLLSDDEFQ